MRCTAGTFVHSHHTWMIRSFCWYVGLMVVGWMLFITIIGIPVATLAIGKAGAINAALLSASILGAKHPQFKRKDARYHVDIFAVTEAVYLDDERVYADGAWTLEAAPLN